MVMGMVRDKIMVKFMVRVMDRARVIVGLLLWLWLGLGIALCLCLYIVRVRVTDRVWVTVRDMVKYMIMIKV